MKIKYLALLRGINVGGNNIIKMSELKECFEEMGFSEVRTYIQSGNVIFQSEEKSTKRLTDQIEKALSKTFNYQAKVVVISEKQLKQVIEEAPKGFGEKKEKYRYDVIFIKPPMTAKKALKETPVKEGVDHTHAGKHAIYFSRLIAKITSSRISRAVGTPVYQFMTIRNWNTTTKLLKLIEELALIKENLKARKEPRLKGNLDKLSKKFNK